jgi:hypothetical protein
MRRANERLVVTAVVAFLVMDVAAGPQAAIIATVCLGGAALLTHLVIKFLVGRR